jgi:rfaE bifunctional protein kinase chain/domain
LTKAEIQKLFNDFSQKTVLLIGDGMIDAYMWGSVSRQSPEAPVPVVDVYQKETRLGGAGNVAKNLAALGARTIFCGFVGDDENGLVFKELLSKNNLEETGLFEVKGRPTTVKTRVIAQDKHVLRVDEEVTDELPNYSAFIARILRIIESQKVDVILFQDYDKGVINAEVINAVVRLAKLKNIPTVVDPKKRNFMAYKGVSFFKPNLKEIKEGLHVDFNVYDKNDLQQTVQKLRDALQADMVLLTLSEHGVYIQHPAGEKHWPAFKRKIIDVSGAGDTVVSVAALALAGGCSPEQVALLANLAGGLVCEEVGVVPINKQLFFDEADALFGK